MSATPDFVVRGRSRQVVEYGKVPVSADFVTNRQVGGTREQPARNGHVFQATMPVPGCRSGQRAVAGAVVHWFASREYHSFC